MSQTEHLNAYRLTLKTKSPLFIGSGKQYDKKEYYFDHENKKVIFINTEKFFSLLIERNLLNEYENYMFLNKTSTLKDFFFKCGISNNEIKELTDYTADAGDTLDPEHSLAEIHQFIRDSNMRPYVPGSSLKGCLRTAILWKLIRQNKNNNLAQKLEKRYNEKGKIIYNTTAYENRYFNTLELDTENPNNAVNSIMRAISISDSMPIDNSRISLAAKIDISVNGKPRPIKKMVREVVIPETDIQFIITFDKSISKELDVDFVKNAISEYGKYYKKTFISHFNLPANAVKENFENCVVLGGGSGYFGKNILYPYYGKSKAIKEVAEIMKQKAPGHHHEQDERIGISPHMLKYTRCGQKSYHFGVCEVKIEPCANVN